MAEVIMTEAPGGLGDAYQCPYCGHTYLAHVVDEGGQLTAQTADPPRLCRRCGSPMDVTAKDGGSAAQRFQDEQAAQVKEAQSLGRRRTVKV